MINKKFWLVILVIVLVFGMAVTGCDNDDKHYSIVGVWGLESVENRSSSGLVTTIEIYEDGTGRTNSGTEFTWELVDGYRWVTSVGSWDVELSENGTLLIFHYSGINFEGDNPQKGFYRRRLEV